MSSRSALHDAIRQAADPIGVMERIVAQALSLVPAADGASLEVRRDAETLEYVAAAGTLAPFIGLQLPIDHSLSGYAVTTSQVQRSDDGLVDPRANRAAVERTGLRSMLCVPLGADDDVHAVLKVCAREVGAFTDSDAERLAVLARFLHVTLSAASELARVTADALANLENLNRDLPETDDEIIAARFVANVMTPGLADRLSARSRVQGLIDRQSVRIVLQPIVGLDSGEVVACEALARMPGEASPAWWFAAAGDAGLAVDLETLAIRRAFEAFDLLPGHIHMAVNVGTSTATDPRMLALLSSRSLERITIEFTEHTAVADYHELKALIDSLRARGAQISIDDTGSGYSGLTHILRLCPDIIKLDRDLVAGLHDDRAKEALASSLISFARSIDALIVAEGIEHADEAQLLRDLGADSGQGYYFARPMEPEAFVEFAQARRGARATFAS